MSILVACTLVFVCELGVAGLWVGIALGIFLIAVFYTRLVIYGTNWQEVALEAAKRMEEEQERLALSDSLDRSTQSYGSYRSGNTSSYVQNSMDNSMNSFMRARD